MNNEGNVYGVQKVPETSVRSDGDIAAGAGQGAATGAAAGAMFGPWGAVIGGVVGAGVGLVGGLVGRGKEREQKEKEEEYNALVDNLEGRSLRTDRIIAQQAEHGMKAKRYMIAEIEGDGSREYEGGIGEIHVDKNFNLKSLAKGAPTHEEGGMKVMMEEGDTIFPTQNSEKKYNNIIADIRRYKMTGDEKAKKRLEKERDKLPTDEDYGYAENGLKYEDGVQSGKADYREQRDVRKMIRKADGKYTLGERIETFRDKFRREKMNEQYDNQAAGGDITDEEVEFYRGEGAGQPPQEPQQKEHWTSKIGKNLHGAGKYAAAMYNLGKSLEPAEKVMRRQVTPTYMDYNRQDAVAQARAIEARNYAMEKAGSTSRGVQQGRQNMVMDQYYRSMENIAAQEQQRQDQVRNYNNQLTNQVQQANVQIAREDDVKDEMNRGAQQAFAAGWAEDFTALSQLGEQRAWQQEFDQKRIDRDQEILDRGLIGSQDYTYNKEKGVMYSNDVVRKKDGTIDYEASNIPAPKAGYKYKTDARGRILVDKEGEPVQVKK